MAAIKELCLRDRCLNIFKEIITVLGTIEETYIKAAEMDRLIPMLCRCSPEIRSFFEELHRELEESETWHDYFDTWLEECKGKRKRERERMVCMYV